MIQTITIARNRQARRWALLLCLLITLYPHIILSRLIHYTRFHSQSTESNLHKIASLSQPSTLAIQSESSYLTPLLIPRVSGTENNTKVQEYIKSTFKSLKSWVVSLDTFTADTPLGTKNFTNIIATKDP
ncbi:hypothetical protein HK097_004840, partial [Rhizophlyctis rosea]